MCSAPLSVGCDCPKGLSWADSSTVLAEADLLRLLAELLTLHEEAVLADQCHAPEAPGHARDPLAFRALQAARRQAVRIAVLPLPHGATQHLNVARSVHDAHGHIVV